MSLYGLTQLNIETTSVCDKTTFCKFCAHQNPSLHPNLKFGEMNCLLMVNLADELNGLGKSLVIQMHRDGDPLAASKKVFNFALGAFHNHIISIVTHGEKLAERADELISNCESVTVSIFRGDPDRELQLTALREFLTLKGDKLPRVFLKVVGDMSEDELIGYKALSVPIMRRSIHTPDGNHKYAHALPLMPEHGVCLDLLHHPSIAWDGRVYLCNRLDTADKGLIGNLNEESLDAIWNGKLRADYIQKHLEGRRADVPPCKDCLYYGIPTA
jgi:radical SAM protein with 4Fe4S-binding SPASM domain